MCAVLEIGTHLLVPVSNLVASKAHTFQASQSKSLHLVALHLHWHCIYVMYCPIVPFHPMNVLIIYLTYDIN